MLQRDELAEDVAVELRRSPEFRAAINDKFLSPRIAVLESILLRARKRGDIGPGVDSKVAYSLVSGPMHHRVFVVGEPVSPSFRRMLLTSVLAALAALSPPPASITSSTTSSTRRCD